MNTHTATIYMVLAYSMVAVLAVVAAYYYHLYNKERTINDTIFQAAIKMNAYNKEMLAYVQAVDQAVQGELNRAPKAGGTTNPKHYCN